MSAISASVVWTMRVFNVVTVRDVNDGKSRGGHGGHVPQMWNGGR